MSHLFRLIDNSIVDFFVQKSEDSRYCRDQILKNSPNLLGDGKLDCLPGYFPEETADGLVVAETSGNRKNIVLKAAQCRGSYLGCKAGALALAEAEIGLAVLEHHFKRPTAGVYFPCFKEAKVCVGGEETVPFSVLCTAHKEYPYGNISENGIVYYIIAFETAAVFLQLEFLAQFHKRRGGEVAMCSMIFCPAVLSDLYHAQPMASYMPSMDELDNIPTGKPAVSQHVSELYAFTYGTLYHFLCQVEFGHVIGLFALAEHLAVVIGIPASPKFFGTHPVIALLTLFSDDVEVKENLRDSVCYRHAEAFEAKNCPVCQMRVDASDFLDGTPRLLMVGIVENQTDILLFMVGAKTYLFPQLDGYAPQCLAPVYSRILHEAVVHILLRLYQRIKHAVLLAAVNVAYAEAGKQQQALEDRQQTVHAVPFTDDTERAVFGHPDPGENVAYVLHGYCHVRTFEKSFDIREKRSNFVHRHGLEYVFWWYLKLLNFCQSGKKPCRFFMPLSL